jgi:hypothetical protein
MVAAANPATHLLLRRRTHARGAPGPTQPRSRVMHELETAPRTIRGVVIYNETSAEWDDFEGPPWDR